MSIICLASNITCLAFSFTIIGNNTQSKYRRIYNEHNLSIICSIRIIRRCAWLDFELWMFEIVLSI